MSQNSIWNSKRIFSASWVITAFLVLFSLAVPKPGQAVSKLSIHAGGNATSVWIDLAWGASATATSYNVKRATVNGGPYATISSPTITTYRDSGVTIGTTYYYVVSALNGSGESPNSNQASGTATWPIPAVPTNVVIAASNARIDLSWTQSPTASSFNVKRSTVNGGPYTTIGTPAPASYSDTGLTNGVTYYYVISAVNPGGESANSVQVSAIPGTYPFDFNGDGRPDLVLQSTANNQIAVWNMNNTTVLAGQNISPTPAAGWRVAGLGDFNGDGKPDLVLQNTTLNKAAIWFMNGMTLIAGVYITASIPAGWTLVAVGDFNGDGKPDIALQNNTTNQVAFWYLNGATLTSGAYLATSPPTGWRVAGCGDFNGDGKLDIVLQNASTSQIAIWYLHGTTVAGGGYVSVTPASVWKVAGAADFNKDGKPDLVLQNSSTNQVAIWNLNGLTVTTGAYTSTTPSTGWKVVAPR